MSCPPPGPSAPEHDETDEAMERARRAPYLVRLLLRAPARVDAKALLAAVEGVHGALLLDADPEARARVVIAFSEEVGLAEGEAGEASSEGSLLHPMVVVEEAERFDASDASDAAVRAALDQTWDWEEAREAVSGCGYAISLFDGNAGGLEPALRLELLYSVLRAVLAQVDAAAIHWVSAQRVVDPHAWLHRVEDGERLSSAAVNVRMFRVEDGKPGEHVMDTVGLLPLGVPDVQCHFVQRAERGAMRPEPGLVAEYLFSIAGYLFEKGDVIQDEDTIEGFQKGEQWVCKHEEALVAPRRIVLDVAPGRWKA